MTKPNTVPSTVKSWFEILKVAGVNPSTVETTTERVSGTQKGGGDSHLSQRG